MPVSVRALPARTLLIGPRARAAAERHRLRAAPREAVGLLVGRAPCRAVAYLPLPDHAPDGRRCFRVDAADLARALLVAGRDGRVALAVVHSHPSGPARASAEDAAGAWAELLTVVVAGPTPARWRAYTPTRATGTTRLERVPVVLALGRRSASGITGRLRRVRP